MYAQRGVAYSGNHCSTFPSSNKGTTRAYVGNTSTADPSLVVFSQNNKKKTSNSTRSQLGDTNLEKSPSLPRLSRNGSMNKINHKMEGTSTLKKTDESNYVKDTYDFTKLERDLVLKRFQERVLNISQPDRGLDCCSRDRQTKRRQKMISARNDLKNRYQLIAAFKVIKGVVQRFIAFPSLWVEVPVELTERRRRILSRYYNTGVQYIILYLSDAVIEHYMSVHYHPLQHEQKFLLLLEQHEQQGKMQPIPEVVPEFIQPSGNYEIREIIEHTIGDNYSTKDLTLDVWMKMNPFPEGVLLETQSENEVRETYFLEPNHMRHHIVEMDTFRRSRSLAGEL